MNKKNFEYKVKSLSHESPRHQQNVKVIASFKPFVLQHIVGNTNNSVISPYLQSVHVKYKCRLDFVLDITPQVMVPMFENEIVHYRSP